MPAIFTNSNDSSESGKSDSVFNALQVYLGKWQETDVAVKVLIEMQHLAPDNEVQPQDPATLEPWINSEEDNHPSQGGTHQKKAANGLIGLTASTLARNSDPVLNKEETQAIKTLEREVTALTGTASWMGTSSHMQQWEPQHICTCCALNAASSLNVASRHTNARK